MTNFFPRWGRALLLSLPFVSFASFAQGVGIGTTAPDASAALDIVSGTKGALLPRVVAASAIASPATGLIVFQTGGTAGYYYYYYYYYAGSVAGWQQLATASGAAVTAGNGLTKTGPNLALGGTLAGATTIAQGGNNFSLTGGNVGIGASAPLAGLHVDTPESASTTAVGVITSGGTSGNPSIELRGSGKTPYIDFVETSGVDHTTRLISSGGTLNVNNTNAAVPALNVGGYTRLSGATAGPAIAMVKLVGTIPGGVNAKNYINLPALPRVKY